MARLFIVTLCALISLGCGQGSVGKQGQASRQERGEGTPEGISPPRATNPSASVESPGVPDVNTVLQDVQNDFRDVGADKPGRRRSRQQVTGDNAANRPAKKSSASLQPPGAPDVTRLLQGVQNNLKDMETDTPVRGPTPRHVTDDGQNSTPAIQKPDIGKASRSRSDPSSMKADGLTRKSDHTSPPRPDVLLVESPVATLAGSYVVVFSPSADSLLVAEANLKGRDKVTLWEVGTWKERDFRPPPPYGLRSAAFSPDGSLLAAYDGGDLRIWQLQNGRATLMTATTASPDTFYSKHTLWSEDGTTLVSRTGQPQTTPTADYIVLWGKTGKKGTIPVNSHEYQLLDVVISPRSEHLITIIKKRGNRLATVWNLSTLAAVTQIPVGQEVWTSAYSCGFSPDGKVLALTVHVEGSSETGGKQLGMVKLYDTSTWKERATLTAEGEAEGTSAGRVNHHFAAFSPNSDLVVTASRAATCDCTDTGSTYTVMIWDVSTGRQLRRFDTHCAETVMFHPNGKVLVTGGNPESKRQNRYSVNFWDVGSGVLRARVIDQGIRLIALSPDGSLLATGGWSQTRVWNLTNHRAVPYEDEYGRSTNEDEDWQEIGRPAPPITKTQFAKIENGMTYAEVKKVLGGSGRVEKHDADALEITIVYRGKGPAEAKATFVFQGKGNSAKLATRWESGLEE